MFVPHAKDWNDLIPSGLDTAGDNEGVIGARACCLGEVEGVATADCDCSCPGAEKGARKRG